MPEISSDEQAVLDYKADLRIAFENARATGPTVGQKGRYKEYAWKLINSGNALIELPVSLFTVTRSAAQQGFNRIFLGQNIGTPQYVPGIRPHGNYRVMVDEAGLFVLLNFDHELAWKEWETYCTERHGMSAYRTEYGTEHTLGGEATEIDSITRGLEPVEQD